MSVVTEKLLQIPSTAVATGRQAQVRGAQCTALGVRRQGGSSVLRGEAGSDGDNVS